MPPILAKAGKMKNIVLCLAVLFSSQEASAMDYDQLAQLFNQGTAVKADEVKKFYSGRCFNNFDHKTAYNALFAYQERVVSPTQKLLKIAAPFTQPNASAEFFDHFTEVYRLDPTVWDRLSFADPNTLNLTYYYDIEPNQRIDLKLEIVRSDKNLVLRVTNLISQTLNNTWTGGTYYAGAGEVIHMCYFFKELNIK